MSLEAGLAAATRPQSVGEGLQETLGQEAKWCGYHGHLSPSPFYFQNEPWRLSKGKSIDLKYRVALHVGTPKEADMDGIYEQWLEYTVL